jgi:hypothetical protein
LVFGSGAWRIAGGFENKDNLQAVFIKKIKLSVQLLREQIDQLQAE